MFYDYENSPNATVQFTEDNISVGSAKKIKVSTKGFSSEDVDKIKLYIRENISNRITVAELAQVAGVSKFHFVRVFKSLTGYTPYQHLIEKRVYYAKQLMENKDLSISSVAYRAGFSNQSHFTTVFKRSTGTTPKKYKDSIKKG